MYKHSQLVDLVTVAVVGFFLLLFAFMMTGCSTSPTGRSRLTLMPDSQMNSMGSEAFSAMKKDTPIENDPRINAYVRCVALPITQVAADPTGVRDWEIVVFRDKSANAFALPGGKIGVHTGILPVAKTADQLAAVLGHEVGHVIARHGNERVSTGLIAQGVLLGANIFTKESKYKAPLMAMLGVGATVGYVLPHSRTNESEADLIGLDLMSKAGFDPRQSVALWENMTAASGGKAPSEFMSTHPSNERRISDLRQHIPENLPKMEAARNAGRNPHCTYP